jgi:hypothetical protein
MDYISLPWFGLEGFIPSLSTHFMMLGSFVGKEDKMGLKGYCVIGHSPDSIHQLYNFCIICHTYKSYCFVSFEITTHKELLYFPKALLLIG